MAKERQEDQATFEQRLSPNQYALMRAIASGDAQHGRKTLEILNYVTFTALIKRGYITIDGRLNPAFTQLGYKAFVTYQELEMPHRNAPGRVTPVRRGHVSHRVEGQRPQEREEEGQMMSLDKFNERIAAERITLEEFVKNQIDLLESMKKVQMYFASRNGSITPKQAERLLLEAPEPETNERSELQWKEKITAV